MIDQVRKILYIKSEMNIVMLISLKIIVLILQGLLLVWRDFGRAGIDYGSSNGLCTVFAGSLIKIRFRRRLACADAPTRRDYLGFMS